MRTVGLIGGLSWQSSAVYYKLINEFTQARLGGLHSARLVLASLDFGPIAEAQHAERWDEIAVQLLEAARKLEEAGADCIALCSNTLHCLAEEIERRLSVPFLHIADPTLASAKALRVSALGLVGTRFTMERTFLSDRFIAAGLEVLTPDARQRVCIHRIIYEELCNGIVRDDSRRVFLDAMKSLASRGAHAIVLGCTEIGLLVAQEHFGLPVLDTTALHASAAVDLMLVAD